MQAPTQAERLQALSAEMHKHWSTLNSAKKLDAIIADGVNSDAEAKEQAAQFAQWYDGENDEMTGVRASYDVWLSERQAERSGE